MVQQRAAGNGNFDIDAITRMVNADANAPALTDQPFVDPVADAFAADVEDMVDELRFNPSSNLTEEAAQIINSPLAARLGAGVMADLRAAIQLQEEKAANGADAFLRGDAVWEEQKEKREKDRKAIDDADDYADKIQNARQQAEQERQERAEAWANSEHTYAGQKMSASEWLRMIQWFKQPENRKAWEDAMMAETGQTREQVQETGEKVDELNALIEKESRGEKLTAEEQARKTVLVNDRNVQDGMRIARERATLAQGIDSVVENRIDAQAASTSSDVTSESATVDSSFDILAGMNVRVSLAQSETPNAVIDESVAGVSTTRTLSVSMQTEGQSEFAANAPSLGASFSAAKAATTPLDVSPEPLRVAVASPAPERQVATSGLDV